MCQFSRRRAIALFLEPSKVDGSPRLSSINPGGARLGANIDIARAFVAASSAGWSPGSDKPDLTICPMLGPQVSESPLGPSVRFGSLLRDGLTLTGTGPATLMAVASLRVRGHTIQWTDNA
jgi:hypothetical protein